MGYFRDGLQISKYIKINGVAMPETSEEIVIGYNNMSDTSLLADGMTLEGRLVGVKVDFELKYALLTREHYLILFNETQRKYNEGNELFLDIEIPCDTEPNGILKVRGYFQSRHEAHVKDTTDKRGVSEEYQRMGAKYDVLYENVVFKFVQK